MLTSPETVSSLRLTVSFDSSIFSCGRSQELVLIVFRAIKSIGVFFFFNKCENCKLFLYCLCTFLSRSVFAEIDNSFLVLVLSTISLPTFSTGTEDGY